MDPSFEDIRLLGTTSCPCIAREISHLQFDPGIFKTVFRIPQKLSSLKNEGLYLTMLTNSTAYMIFLTPAWMIHLSEYLLIKSDVLLTIILAQNQRVNAPKSKDIEEIPGCRTHPKGKVKQRR